MKKTVMATLLGGLSCAVYAGSNFDYDAVALNYEHSVYGIGNSSNDFEIDSMNAGIDKELNHQILIRFKLGYAWGDEVFYDTPYRFKTEGDARGASVSLGRYFVISERFDLIPAVSVGHTNSRTTLTVDTYSETLVREPRYKETFKEMLTTYNLSLAANVYLGGHQKWTFTPKILLAANDSDSDTEQQFSMQLAGRVADDFEITGLYRFDLDEDFYSYVVGVRYFY